MELNGIDISGYQANIDLSKVAADFVIVKATEGISYVSPVCDHQYQQAKKLGKLLGVYHYAHPEYNSAISEVDFFVKNIKGYLLSANVQSFSTGSLPGCGMYHGHCSGCSISGRKPGSLRYFTPMKASCRGMIGLRLQKLVLNSGRQSIAITASIIITI